MSQSEVIKEIFRRADIDFSLLKNPSEAVDLATEILDRVLVKHASGDPMKSLSPAERRTILNEVADELVKELHGRFHRR